MSRNGHLILACIMIGLALFVFWPGGYRSKVPVYDGEAPARYTLTGYGYRQAVDGDRVVITAGEHRLERQTSAQARTLWRYLQRIRVDQRSVREDVDAGQLPAYGIDDRAPLLKAETGAWRWAQEGEAGYIYERRARRMFRCQPYWIQRLDEAARRLDRMELLDQQQPMVAVGIGDYRFRHEQGVWQQEGAPQRPALGPRVGDLARLLFAVELSRPAGATMPATVEERLRGSLRQVDGERRSWRLLSADETTWFWALDALPVQPLPAADAQRLLSLDEQFGIDRLFAFRDTLMGNPIEGLAVYQGARRWFTLERRGEDDEWEGESMWDLSWDAGRVRAASGSPYMLGNALNAIVIDDWQHHPRPREWQAPLDPSVVSLLIDLGDRRRHLLIDGERLQTRHYDARAVELPELLADLRPERFIDPMIHNIEQTRLIKIQRLTPQGGEVFAFDGDRGWERVHPEPGPVVASAMEQLLAAIAHLRAESARIQSTADRAILADPTLEIDARIAPRKLETGEDDVRIEHTIERDWGLALAREGEGWRAVDKESGISYHLSEAQVGECFRSLERPVLLPVVSTRIAAVQVERQDGGGFKLSRREAGWQLLTEGYQGPADEVPVRRLLQVLANASYLEAFEGQRAIEATARLATVEVRMSGAEGDDRSWTLELGRAAGDELLANVLRGDGLDAAVHRGSYLVPGWLLERCCPDGRHLVPPEATLEAP